MVHHEKDELEKFVDDEMSIYLRIYAIRDIPIKERILLIREMLNNINGYNDPLSDRSIRYLIRSTKIKAKNGALTRFR